MILEAVVSSVLIGWLRKGKVMRLAYVDVQWIYLFMFGALGQALLFNLADADGMGFRMWLYEYFYWCHLLTYLLILVPVVLNVKLSGFLYMAVGTVLNFIPIIANGGKMPVKVPEGYSKIFDMGHTLLTENTKFPWLSDLFFVGPPYPLPKVLSIGDLFLIAGVFWFIQKTMTSDNAYDIEASV